MAAGQSNDPAKILSDMLAAGQDLLRKFGVPQTPARDIGLGDGSPDLLAAAKQAAELQQQALKQAADLCVRHSCWWDPDRRRRRGCQGRGQAVCRRALAQ